MRIHYLWCFFPSPVILELFFFFSGQQQSAWTCDYFQALFDGVQVCFKYCIYTGCINDAALVKPKNRTEVKNMVQVCWVNNDHSSPHEHFGKIKKK